MRHPPGGRAGPGDQPETDSTTLTDQHINAHDDADIFESSRVNPGRTSVAVQRRIRAALGAGDRREAVRLLAESRWLRHRALGRMVAERPFSGRWAP